MRQSRPKTVASEEPEQRAAARRLPLRRDGHHVEPFNDVATPGASQQLSEAPSAAPERCLARQKSPRPTRPALLPLRSERLPRPACLAVAFRQTRIGPICLAACRRDVMRDAPPVAQDGVSSSFTSHTSTEARTPGVSEASIALRTCAPACMSWRVSKYCRATAVP